jgi:peptidoglycan/LPS O-acetylase OafA/YrhL
VTSSGLRRDIQGLRALAVLVVIAFHFHLTAFGGGFVGVDIFFVISGFVITSALRREWRAHGRVSLSDFYARRVRRILPASTLVLLATVGVSVWWYGRGASAALFGDARAAFLFGANLHFAGLATGYFTSSSTTSPLLHYWSLAVEEQFYVVVPLLFVPLSRWRRGERVVPIVLGAMTVISLLIAVAWTSSSPIVAYYSMWTRAWELGVGCLLAWAPRPRRGATSLWFVGVAMMTWSVVVYNSTTAFPGTAALVPVLGAALSIAAGDVAKGPLAALSRSRIAGWWGDRSFSLYLWHLPVYLLGNRRYLGHMAHLRFYELLATVGLAALSYRFIEQPARRLRWRGVGRRVILGAGATVVAGGALVMTMLVPSSGATATTTSPDVARLLAQVAAARATTHLPTDVQPVPMDQMSLAVFSFPRELSDCTVSHRFLVRMPICTFGDRGATRAIMLYGNSQAEMYAPTLDWFGRRYHWRVDVLSKPACGVFLDPHYIDEVYHQTHRCYDYARYAATMVRTHHEDFVVVATTPGYRLRPHASTTLVNGRLPLSSLAYPDGTEMGVSLAAWVKAAAIAPSHVIVLSSMPVGRPGAVNFQPNPCLLAHRTNIARCGATVSTANTGLARASAMAHTDYLDVLPLYCSHGVCPPVVDHVLVRFDSVHITRLYALHIARAFTQLLLTEAPALGRG